MEFAICELVPLKITERFKGLSKKRREEFLDIWEVELERCYNHSIDDLADMVFGKRPDITIPC